MTNSDIQPGIPTGGSPIQSAQAAEVARNSKRASESQQSDSPAFRVLLDRLQEQAAKIESESRTLENPEALAEAVDIARTSLDDALSLSDKLLEAFREAQHHSPASESPEPEAEDETAR